MNRMTRWWLVGGGAVIGALLVVSVVLALTNRETAFPPGSPEAVVQELLRAAENEDFEAAYSLLSQDLRRRCALEKFVMDNHYGYYYDYGDDGDILARLDSVDVVGDTAFVSVNVTRYDGSSPFEISRWLYERRYTLQDDGDGWKFTDYPWPYVNCDEGEFVED